jgi:hypothetical protein
MRRHSHEDCAVYKRVLFVRSRYYGFSVLPAGNRANNGSQFNNRGIEANFWSSSAYSDANAWNRNFNYNEARVNRNNPNRSNGLSVRCVRDSTNKTAGTNAFYSLLCFSGLGIYTCNSVFFFVFLSDGI